MAERLWFTHGRRERHGFRWWLHLGRARRRVIGVEVNWWGRFCHIGVETNDDGWKVSLAFPPVAVWLTLEGFPLWQPTYTTPLHQVGGVVRMVNLPDRRECRLSIHDWTIWLSPWSRWGEWRASDPWWVRGVSLNLKDVALGRTRYICDKIGDPFDVSIPMPEGNYRAVFQRQRQTWRRPRWFSITRESYDIDIPKGIPFAGKGENSWDCDDDGLFGMGAEGTVDEAVAKVQESVERSRRKYGHASAQTVEKALAP